MHRLRHAGNRRFARNRDNGLHIVTPPAVNQSRNRVVSAESFQICGKFPCRISHDRDRDTDDQSLYSRRRRNADHTIPRAQTADERVTGLH
jgi:hypothetical protein